MTSIALYLFVYLSINFMRLLIGQLISFQNCVKFINLPLSRPHSTDEINNSE